MIEEEKERMQVDKLSEKKLLLKRIFPTPYAGYEDTLALFKIGRKLGDQYCLRFDERGYTPTYERFDSEQVVERVAELISDQDLLRYAKEFKEKLSEYSDFKGKYYSYFPKSKELKLESEWHSLKAEGDKMFHKHGNAFIAVLGACWEANVKLDKKWDNWWIIFSIAKEHGLEKGWLTILADLERIRLIERHKGDIRIPEERIPLIEAILKKYNYSH